VPLCINKRDEHKKKKDIMPTLNFDLNDERQKFIAKSAGNPITVDSTVDTWKNICIGFLSLTTIIFVVAFIVCEVNQGNTTALTQNMLTMEPNQLLASTTQCPLEQSTLISDLERLRTRVRNEAERRGTVSWTTYSADREQHAGKRIELSQADFSSGTVRLTTTGVFVLTEDVVFEPNSENDWRPDRVAQPEYAGAPFILDFFAAITVEAANIVIDLNGHTIAQTPVHAIQQRFFANIELAGQPFLHGQGPSSFGAAPAFADGLVIENGRLGRSSHHSLHGNGGKRVLLQDLEMVDYEVAAIALNGFKDTVIRRVQARGQFVHIPVLGTYSNARFMLPFIDRILSMGESVGIGALKLEELAGRRDELVDLMDIVVDDVRSTGWIDATSHPTAAALFSNPTGLCDGNSYSLLVHPNGVAVGRFWSADPPESGSDLASERILVMDSTFAETRAHIVEVVALVSPANSTVRGVAGDVLRVFDNEHNFVMGQGVDGQYMGNALSDTQIAVMDAALDVNAANPMRKALFGTLSGGAPVVAWAHGQRTLRSLVEDDHYKFWRNGDTMFHVNKGVVAVRIDGARDVCLSRVTISNTSNSGKRGLYDALPGEGNNAAAAYVGATDGGHPDQGRQYGYMGADTRGIGISGSADVYLQEVRVDGVHSRVGLARGIDIFNHAHEIHICMLCSINNVTTLYDDSDDSLIVGDYTMGPKVGSAVGIHCSGGSAAATFGGSSIVITEVNSGVFDQAHTSAVSTEIEASDVELVHVNTYEL